MRKDNRGFTLIEVILAMAILALVFLPMMKYYTDSARVSRLSRDKQNASFLAESLLEEVRSVRQAEEIRPLMEKRGLTVVRETAHGVPDYKAEYGGYLTVDDRSYWTRLEVDFAAEKDLYHNDREIVLPPFLSANAVQVLEGEQPALAVEYFTGYLDETNGEEAPPAESDVLKSLERKIIVKIEKTALDAEYAVTAYESYTSSMAGEEVFDTSDEGSYLCREIINKSDWEALYIFYHPMGDQAEIELFVEEELPLKELYLICQTKTADGREQQLNEQKLWITGADKLKNCTLRTNLNSGAVVQEASTLSVEELLATQEARLAGRIIASVYEKKPEEGTETGRLVRIETKKGE